MKRYDRIGVTKHWYEIALWEQQGLHTFHPEACPLETRGEAWGLQATRLGAISFGHYLNDDLEEAKKWGELLIATVETYFNGAWRQQVTGRDAEYWANGGGYWTSDFRNALAFALALDDINAAKRLSRFPPIGCEDGTSFKRRRPWYIAVALTITSPKSMATREAMKAALSAKDKGTPLYSGCLNAILARDSNTASELFKACMKHYLMSDKKLDEFDVKLAADASILFHLARRSKVDLDTAKWKDYLIELS